MLSLNNFLFDRFLRLLFNLTLEFLFDFEKFLHFLIELLIIHRLSNFDLPITLILIFEIKAFLE